MTSILFALLMAMQQQIDAEKPLRSVPAISYLQPASRPCNLSSGPFLTCYTGPELRWTCLDKSRALLQSEDGQRFCIKIQD